MSIRPYLCGSLNFFSHFQTREIRCGEKHTFVSSSLVVSLSPNGHKSMLSGRENVPMFLGIPLATFLGFQKGNFTGCDYTIPFVCISNFFWVVQAIDLIFLSKLSHTQLVTSVFGQLLTIVPFRNFLTRKLFNGGFGSKWLDIWAGCVCVNTLYQTSRQS
jgi:hypothetical protein